MAPRRLKVMGFQRRGSFKDEEEKNSDAADAPQMSDVTDESSEAEVSSRTKDAASRPRRQSSFKIDRSGSISRLPISKRTLPSRIAMERSTFSVSSLVVSASMKIRSAPVHVPAVLYLIILFLCFNFVGHYYPVLWSMPARRAALRWFVRLNPTLEHRLGTTKDDDLRQMRGWEGDMGRSLSEEEKGKRWRTEYVTDYRIDVGREGACIGVVPSQFPESDMTRLPIHELSDLYRPDLRTLVLFPRHGLGNSLRGYVSAFVFAQLAARRLVIAHGAEHFKVYDLLCEAFLCGFDALGGIYANASSSSSSSRSSSNSSSSSNGDSGSSSSSSSSSGSGGGSGGGSSDGVDASGNHVSGDGGSAGRRFQRRRRALLSADVAGLGENGLFTAGAGLKSSGGFDRQPHTGQGGPREGMEDVLELSFSDLGFGLSGGDTGLHHRRSLLAVSHASGSNGGGGGSGSKESSKVEGTDVEAAQMAAEIAKAMDLARNFGRMQPLWFLEVYPSIKAIAASIQSDYPIFACRSGSHFDLFYTRDKKLRDCVYAAFQCSSLWCVHSRAVFELIGRRGPSPALLSTAFSILHRVASTASGNGSSSSNTNTTPPSRTSTSGSDMETLIKPTFTEAETGVPASEASAAVEQMFDVAVHVRTRTLAVEKSIKADSEAYAEAECQDSDPDGWKRPKFLRRCLWDCVGGLLAGIRAARDAALMDGLEGGEGRYNGSGADGPLAGLDKVVYDATKRGAEEGKGGKAGDAAKEFTILLATDDMQLRPQMVEILRPYGTVYFSTGVVLHTSKAGGSSSKRLPTMAEFFLMSRSHTIIEAGSYISTFAYFAGLMGNGTLSGVRMNRNKCRLKHEHVAGL